MKSVAVRGKRLAYRENGRGRDLLLVHGNTASSLWYSRVMDLPGLRSIAPDLPNFGDSARLDGADIDLYADFLLGFMDELGLANPAVVGHSLGGAVAMSLAVRHPDRVKGLMLVDSCPAGGLATAEAHYPVIERYKTDRALLKQALRMVTPAMKDETFLEELVDAARKMNPIAFEGNARALARFDCSGRASAYRGRVLVVAGALDVIIDQGAAERTAADFPNAELKMLAGVGHSVMVEDPALFRSLVIDFMNSLP
jgi:branched-chain amino acid transport system permease protein